MKDEPAVSTEQPFAQVADEQSQSTVASPGLTNDSRLLVTDDKPPAVHLPLSAAEATVVDIPAELPSGPPSAVSTDVETDAETDGDTPPGAAPPLPAGATGGPLPFQARYDSLHQSWVIDLTDHDLSPKRSRLRRKALKRFEHAMGGRAFVKRVTTAAKPSVVVASSFLAGYCDAVGYVAMSMFTAHVTGNIVLTAVRLASDPHQVWASALALPVFVLSVALAYSLTWIVRHWHRRVLLVMQLGFFLLSFVIGMLYGPFKPNRTHTPEAFACALAMTAGMSVQNSYQRVHLVGLPITTGMTGNITQLTHDTVEIVMRLVVNRRDIAKREPTAMAPIYARFRNNFLCITAFFVAAVLASVLYDTYQMWALLPPVVGVAAMLAVLWQETAMPKQNN